MALEENFLYHIFRYFTPTSVVLALHDRIKWSYKYQNMPNMGRRLDAPPPFPLVKRVKQFQRGSLFRVWEVITLLMTLEVKCPPLIIHLPRKPGLQIWILIRQIWAQMYFLIVFSYQNWKRDIFSFCFAAAIAWATVCSRSLDPF